MISIRTRHRTLIVAVLIAAFLIVPLSWASSYATFGGHEITVGAAPLPTPAAPIEEDPMPPEGIFMFIKYLLSFPLFPFGP